MPLAVLIVSRFPSPSCVFLEAAAPVEPALLSVASRLLVLGLLLCRSQLGGAGGSLRPVLPHGRCQPQLAPTCHGESSRENIHFWW